MIGSAEIGGCYSLSLLAQIPSSFTLFPHVLSIILRNEIHFIHFSSPVTLFIHHHCAILLVK